MPGPQKAPSLPSDTSQCWSAHRTSRRPSLRPQPYKVTLVTRPESLRPLPPSTTRWAVCLMTVLRTNATLPRQGQCSSKWQSETKLTLLPTTHGAQLGSACTCYFREPGVMPQDVQQAAANLQKQCSCTPKSATAKAPLPAALAAPATSPGCASCTDVQPPGSLTCSEQSGFGKCEAGQACHKFVKNRQQVPEACLLAAGWLTAGGYCKLTCGMCSCNLIPAVSG